MAARDRYTIDLKCPKCGLSGTAHVSEDDYPFMRRLDFRVGSVPDGFSLIKEGESLGQTEFVCATCRIPAR